MNKFSIGQTVNTPIGQGTIKDQKTFPYDGICYLVKLDDGKEIWRKESVLKEIEITLKEKIAKVISETYNININEILNVISGV